MRLARSSTTFKTVLGVTAAAVLSLPLAACSAASEDKPDPVAQVDNLSGQDTSVMLDQGFVDALASLKLTPGVVGDAKLADGSVSFPITGGDVTYYEPGSIDPYVQGIIEHDGSGLSLTAGVTRRPSSPTSRSTLEPPSSMATWQSTVSPPLITRSSSSWTAAP